MPNTPILALPYPDGAAKLGQLPAQIKALADALDARAPRIGQVSWSPTQGVTLRDVVFATPFPAGVVPRVVYSGDINLDFVTGLSITNKTNTGFRIVIKHNFNGGLSTVVDYIAMRP